MFDTVFIFYKLNKNMLYVLSGQDIPNLLWHFWAGYFNLGTTDIWGYIIILILSCRGLSAITT